MSIKDIIKKSFLDGFASGSVGAKEIIVCMAIALAFGVFIFIVHRIFSRKTFYDKNFGASLVCMCVITAAVVLTIQQSFVVSLGMVGALSIVRFRNAIKNPLDIVYLFWAITTGIICGAGFAEIAVILALLVTIALFMLDVLPVAKAPMLIVLNADSIDVERAAIEVIKKYSTTTNVKSRNLSRNDLNEVIEVRIKNGADCISEILKINGVRSVSLLNHDGEVSF